MADNPWLGDNTAEDWDDRRYFFWAVIDPHTGEQTGLSRTEPKRDKRGRPLPGEHDYRHMFCETHMDYEENRRPITGLEALAWAHELNAKREAEASKVGSDVSDG